LELWPLVLGTNVKRTSTSPICKLWSAPLSGVMISTSSSSSEKVSAVMIQPPQAQVWANFAAAYSYLPNQSFQYHSYCLPLNYRIKATWLYLRETGGLISVPKRILMPLISRVAITLYVGDQWEAPVILSYLYWYM
jgi:hypothetical protein